MPALLCGSRLNAALPRGRARKKPAEAGATSARGMLFAGTRVARAVRERVRSLDGLWWQLAPMATLSFLMATVNAVSENIKDTLIVTAFGVQQLAFLPPYASLPASFAFVVCFNRLARRLPRRVLFDLTIAFFAGLFALFASIVYPHSDSLHSLAGRTIADRLASFLPAGLQGLALMVRNFTFTGFYIVCELWGDVVLNLLFWGLANETTSHSNAKLLYPLFGFGANLAQVAGGAIVKWAAGHHSNGFSGQINLLTAVICGSCLLIVALHNLICSRFGHSSKSKAAPSPSPPPAPSSEAPESKEEEGEKRGMGLRQAMSVIAANPQIRWLAIIALAQGIAMNMVEFSWKAHVKMAKPSPEAYSAFMGAVASALGVTTTVFQFASPFAFRRLGWGATASLMPIILFFGGVTFLGAGTVRALMGASGEWLLGVVVLVGGATFVVAKGSRFAVQKPAEEMVYMRLDERSRTQGKAAVDVFVAQAGKSGGSVLQQLLLLAFAGSVSGMLPVILALLTVALRGWLLAIRRLNSLVSSP